MLPTRRFRGWERDPRRLLTMLGRLGVDGAEIASEPKGAFMLQAPEPSNVQERERPICSLATGLALGRTQTLRSTKTLKRAGAELFQKWVSVSFANTAYLQNDDESLFTVYLLLM